MKIRIGDTLYDFEDINRASVRDVLELHKITQNGGGKKVSVKSIYGWITKLTELANSDAGVDPFEFMDDDDYLANTVGIAFLLRRQAGESVSWDEAASVPASLLFTPEDIVNDEVEGDPKAPNPVAEDVPPAVS